MNSHGNLNINDITVIIPTHSSYIDIVKNFLEIFSINFRCASCRIVLSICGERITIDGVVNLYNGTDASLIDCVINARKKYPSLYYLCFLGDAFVTKEIDCQNLFNLLNTLYNNEIHYCSMLCVKNYASKKLLNKKIRYIHSKDRYSHNFVSYIADNYYIDNILAKFKSDFDFEMHYLLESRQFYYKNDVIFTENYFGIYPGITKGKWDKIVLYILKIKYPKIRFSSRSRELLFESIYSVLRNTLLPYIPNNLRLNMKKKIKFINKKSVTNK